METGADFYTDRFFERLYTETLASARRGASENKAEKKALLRGVMGMDKLELIRPVNKKPGWKIIQTGNKNGYKLEEAVSEILPGLNTPVYILTPPGFTRTFVYIHGHGDGAEEAVRERYADNYQRRLPVTLAREGYRVIVPELMGFNRVVSSEFDREYERGCYNNSTKLLMFGITMTAVRVRQALDAIYYSMLDDLKPPVIGGISGGGLVTAYTAALCGGDIAGAFISCFTNTFRGSIMPLFHCVDNFIPNILSVGEEPDIIALACPTPLLISAGENDPIFPIAQTREAIEIIKKAYEKENAGSAVTTDIFTGGHEISTEKLLPWVKGLQG